jgi:hypothetical protein
VKARAIASIVAAGLVLGGVAGCTFVTPIATQNQYDASDGINVTVGDVKLLNAIVITDDGKTGNLVAQAYNESDDPIDLTLQYDVSGKHTVDVTLPANEGTKLGYGKKGQVFLPKIGTDAGGLLKVYVQYGSEAGKQVDVPVLSNALHPYRNLTPTPTPTPTPTFTPDPSGSATPGAPTPSSTPTAK